MDPMIYDLQKAGSLKRVSAFLLDFIMLISLTVGLASLMSWAFGFDRHYDTMNDGFEAYEQQYGVVFDITQEEYKAKSEADRQLYDDAYKALISDTEVVYAYNMVFNLTLVIATLSIFLSFLLLEFAVPMFVGNGQTLGKKIFAIGVMRTDGVRINGPLLFIRTVLGKFTIETMIPVLTFIMIFFNTIGILGAVIILGLLIAQVVSIIATRTNSTLHDLLAKTVAVDMSTQLIFGSEAELIAYKTKVNAEQVAKKPY